MEFVSALMSHADCYPHCSCEALNPTTPHLGLDFWSSLGYFLAAGTLYLHTKKKSFTSEFWTFVTINLAISSMLFHAFYLQWTLALDYASINMALLFFTVLPFFRKLFKCPRMVELALLIFYIILWILFLFLNKTTRISLSFGIFLISLIEITQTARLKPLTRGNLLAVSVVLILTSFLCFLLEELRVWCHPDNVIQGHVVWHLGSAFAIYLYGRWRFNL